MLETCHFETKIRAIIPCHYLKNGTHNFVSLTRKMQSHKLKRHIVVNKDARFITFFQVHTYEDSDLLLFLKCVPTIPCTFPLRWNCIPIIPFLPKVAPP